MTLIYALPLYLTLFLLFAIFFCKEILPSKANDYFGVTLLSGICAGMSSGFVALLCSYPEFLFVLLGVALMFGIVYIVNYFVNGMG